MWRWFWKRFWVRCLIFLYICVSMYLGLWKPAHTHQVIIYLFSNFKSHLTKSSDRVHVSIPASNVTKHILWSNLSHLASILYNLHIYNRPFPSWLHGKEFRQFEWVKNDRFRRRYQFTLPRKNANITNAQAIYLTIIKKSCN